MRDMVRELLAQPRAAKSAEVGACVGVHVHQVHGGRAICDGEVRFLVVLDGHPEAHGGAPAGGGGGGACTELHGQLRERQARRKPGGPLRVVVAIRSASEDGIADELQDCAVRYGDARYFSISAVGVEGVVLIEGAEEGLKGIQVSSVLEDSCPVLLEHGNAAEEVPDL